MEEGTLAKWLVKEGDTVKSGDILAEIETDKATMEFEAVDEGTIGQILVPEGTDGVKVGQAIALMTGEGEDASAPAPAAAKAEPTSPADDQRPRAPRQAGTEATPTRHQMEPAARDLVADVAKTVDEPDVPEGTEMATMTVREALRDAMAEEMRRDDARVRDGRGGRRISGRLQGHAGPARRVRRPARDRYADHRIWLCRARHRRGDGRACGRSSSS